MGHAESRPEIRSIAADEPIFGGPFDGLLTPYYHIWTYNTRFYSPLKAHPTQNLIAPPAIQGAMGAGHPTAEGDLPALGAEELHSYAGDVPDVPDAEAYGKLVALLGVQVLPYGDVQPSILLPSELLWVGVQDAQERGLEAGDLSLTANAGGSRGNSHAKISSRRTVKGGWGEVPEGSGLHDWGGAEEVDWTRW